MGCLKSCFVFFRNGVVLEVSCWKVLIVFFKF